MNFLVLNPLTKHAGNVVRDVLYGCWCKGKRIGGGTVPPFNLLVLTTMLRQAGHGADFLDAQAEQIRPEDVRRRIGRYDGVIMSTSTMSFREDADYLASLKGVNPKLTTIVFGSHPTFMPNHCLAHPGVDVAVRHEPEHIIRDLAGRLAAGRDYTDLPGIGCRGSDGKPVLNPAAPFIKNLDDLPYPDVDLLPEDIHYFNPIVRRLPYITTTTSKGCPGKCIFCTAPAFDGHTTRFQSADYVIRELEYFAAKGIKEVYFRDDTFFVNKPRDRKICRAIIDKGLDLTWLANARVGMITEDMIELAGEAGCHTIKFGIESGDQRILDGMVKGYRIERAYEVFGAARRVGVRTHAHVMIGNPGDTRESVERTIDFVLRLDPDTATFGICTPYPGAPLFDRVAAVCPEIGDGSSSDFSKLHVEGLYNEHYCELASEDLPKLVRRAYRKFYLRPGYWLSTARRQITGLNDIKRLSIAGANLMDFIFRGHN